MIRADDNARGAPQAIVDRFAESGGGTVRARIAPASGRQSKNENRFRAASSGSPVGDRSSRTAQGTGGGRSPESEVTQRLFGHAEGALRGADAFGAIRRRGIDDQDQRGTRA